MQGGRLRRERETLGRPGGGLYRGTVGLRDIATGRKAERHLDSLWRGGRRKERDGKMGGRTDGRNKMGRVKEER